MAGIRDIGSFARVSRRGAVALGLLSVLGVETAHGARKKSRKRRRDCRKGQIHCAGRCFNKKRSICCKEGKREFIWSKDAHRCPVTAADRVGGGCPAEFPVCCQERRGDKLVRQCVPADYVCCPIGDASQDDAVDGDEAGGACPADSPTCCQWYQDGVVSRMCGPAGDVCCPAIDAARPGGGCPPETPVCCYLPTGGWYCDPPGSTCASGSGGVGSVRSDSWRAARPQMPGSLVP
jgi:hypothetical protein